ncbi:MAG: hypothetical protein V5A43_05995 [Haloarculaceae archaeon]
MQATQSTDPRTAWRAVVAVRVPPTDGDDLATSASRRLEHEDDVADAIVKALRGVEPAMAATVVTVEVRVEATAALDDAGLADCLTDAPGTQRVEEVEPV